MLGQRTGAFPCEGQTVFVSAQLDPGLSPGERETEGEPEVPRE